MDQGGSGYGTGSNLICGTNCGPYDETLSVAREFAVVSQGHPRPEHVKVL